MDAVIHEYLYVDIPYRWKPCIIFWPLFLKVRNLGYRYEQYFLVFWIQAIQLDDNSKKKFFLEKNSNKSLIAIKKSFSTSNSLLPRESSLDLFNMIFWYGAFSDEYLRIYRTFMKNLFAFASYDLLLKWVTILRNLRAGIFYPLEISCLLSVFRKPAAGNPPTF